MTPPESAALDFELEVAAVVGAPARGGTSLTPEEGAAAILGYTIMNDWSARDVQLREMAVRLGPAKGKDFGTALGPWIVTADEFTAATDGDGFLQLRAVARVNGTVVGDDVVANMGWPFGELVAYASRNARVVPGDVIGSGTVGNGGCLGETTSSFLAAPFLLAGTDMYGFVPARLAEQYAEGLGLTIARTPAPRMTLVETVYWHPSKKNDPALHWLVATLRRTAELVEFGPGTE